MKNESELLKAAKEALRQMDSMCASACARHMSVKWTLEDSEALERLSKAVKDAEASNG